MFLERERESVQDEKMIAMINTIVEAGPVRIKRKEKGKVKQKQRVKGKKDNGFLGFGGCC